MEKHQLITIVGSIPSLTTTLFEPAGDNAPDIAVKSYSVYRRFAVHVVDNGLDNHGLNEGDYAIFREQMWPSYEGQVCLVTIGSEVTMRVLEYIHNGEVTLRVSGDQIEPIELASSDFSVFGVLDSAISSDEAHVVYPQDIHEIEVDPSFEFLPDAEWGC